MTPQIYNLPNVNESYLNSFITYIEDSFKSTVQKVKDFIASPAGQTLIGVQMGIMIGIFSGALTEKVFTALDIPIPADPLGSLNLTSLVILSPYICLIRPLSEEQMLRGSLHDYLKESFESFYVHLDCSPETAKTASRISAIFFGSIIFGIYHLSNALVFLCNPMNFLPQAVAATFMGLFLGIAKEVTGELYLSNGMRVANNSFITATLMHKLL